MLNGLQIIVGETNNCLDSSGGSAILVYPCYEESVQNYNQVWHIKDGHLIWRQGHHDLRVDAKPLPPKDRQHPKGTLTMQTCVPKPGQRLRRDKLDQDGTFLLRDADNGGCLINNGRDELAIGECSADQRWRELVQSEQVQHVSTGNCIDSGAGESRPILYACHKPRTSRKQKFKLVDTPGWIQMEGTWGDNGRKRWFEKCLDHMPAEPISVTVQKCQRTEKQGTRWEKLHAEQPLERRLWEQAEKPPPGALPLGGSAAPP
mmetsp:Transcript_55114/g.178541  ORF Transcript_55114/g.178541 Transcript_55114/m.178541 type:complete len:261 (+) Transcript_55114:2110-2892(+)